MFGNDKKIEIYRESFLKSEIGKEQIQKYVKLDNETDVLFKRWVNSEIFGIPEVDTSAVNNKIADLDAKINKIIDLIEPPQGGANV